MVLQRGQERFQAHKVYTYLEVLGAYRIPNAVKRGRLTSWRPWAWPGSGRILCWMCRWAFFQFGRSFGVSAKASIPQLRVSSYAPQFFSHLLSFRRRATRNCPSNSGHSWRWMCWIAIWLLFAHSLLSGMPFVGPARSSDCCDSPSH